MSKFTPVVNPYKLEDCVPLMVDSYKFGHFKLYPAATNAMFAYTEPRTQGDVIVPFGLQMFIKRWLLTQITPAMVDEAEAFCKGRGDPFNRAGWDKVVEEYNGFMPIKIRTVPEGTRVPSGNIISSVECDDKDLFWLASYVETMLQRAIWYPTTIASNDYKAWRAIRRFNRESAMTETLVPFTLHDFGGRGVNSHEGAEIGGAAHMVFFMGSDTCEGVRAANHYYNTPMSGFSVVATEHSIQCAYGPFNQREYLTSVLNEYGKPGAIVSIVLDGYDVYREAALLCSMKDEIVASGAKIVFRPDSGDPLEVIPALLRMQEAAFGATMNQKGFKVINNVGIIQGDGVDFDAMVKILEKVTEMGFSSDCIVFGSGGALLQKVNRDTFKFAQKTTSIRIGKKWVDLFKDPITDPGKKSKKGRMTLIHNTTTDEYRTVLVDDPLPLGFEDAMITVYDKGQLLNETTLDEIRARAHK